MPHTLSASPHRRQPWRLLALFLIVALLAAGGSVPAPAPSAQAQGPGQPGQVIPPFLPYLDPHVDPSWPPDYLHLATGDPDLRNVSGDYEWPFYFHSIGWNMQSYQHYGGAPYFHHGIDMMQIHGTQVFTRFPAQVVDIQNYQPGNDLYWRVAVKDPDGYIWQYHHIDKNTIPQYIKDKYTEYLFDPINGGFIPADTHVGNIVYWPAYNFHHIHMNILAAGGVYVNAQAFHVPLPDTAAPHILALGLLQNGQIYPGNVIDGDYSLFVRTRDLVLSDIYYLPPHEITFSVDGGLFETTWRFDTIPGGADRYAYVHDFYVVPPTCGNYTCRDYYIDLGFIPDAQYEFPCTGGPHTIVVTVRDFVGNTATDVYNYTVFNHPPIAHPQSVVTDEDVPVEIVLTGSDENCDILTFHVVDGPSYGTLTGAAPELVYTPDLDYYGPDEFTFVVSDGLITSTPALVDITVRPVNDPPVAHPQAVTTTQDIPVEIVLTGHDVEDDPLTFHIVAWPEHGALGGAPPEVVYTPTAGYHGHDAFTFIVNDGEFDSDPALVDITVLLVNEPPVAHPQAVTTTRNTAIAILLTGYDPDDDPLTFHVIDGPEHGMLGGSAPDLVYTPTAGYAGLDAFSFVVNDGLITSTPAVVSITVLLVNEPPVAHPQAVTTTQDTAVEIVLTGYDPDDDPLTFHVVDGPEHGMLGGSAPDLVYTPTAGYAGLDAFSFVVNDGELASEPAVVSITVKPVWRFYLQLLFKPQGYAP